jgi:cell division protein FtsB
MTAVEMALGGAVTLLGGNSFWGWLSSRGKVRIDLLSLTQSVAAATIQSLQADRTALLNEIAGLKQEVRDLSAKIDSQDEKIETLTQHIENLEDTVRSLGGTPPPRPRKRADA